MRRVYDPAMRYVYAVAGFVAALVGLAVVVGLTYTDDYYDRGNPRNP